MNSSLSTAMPLDEAISILNATETIAGMEVNDRSSETFPPNESINYFFVPMASFATVLFLSAMVYLMARAKRKMFIRMYQKVKSPSDYTLLEASDFEHDEDNEDDPNACLLTGKLQIENRYDSYPIHSYSGSRELYT